MKTSPIRLTLMAATLGVSFIPRAAHAQTEGTPLRQEKTPLKQHGTPLSKEGTPLSKEGTPLSKEGTPLSKEGTPLSKEGTPLSKEGTPLSKEGTPIGESAVPLAQEGTPLKQEGRPLAEAGIPLADYGTPTEQAQELRRRNRAAAMQDPQTASFFGGDAEARRLNTSRNLSAAFGEPTVEDAESVSQQDAQDRDWSLGAIDSAQSRPRDLFSSDWWKAHSDVLEESDAYYTAKPASAWWQASPWRDLVRVLGMRGVVEPFKYRNDRNVLFRNDLIYVNGQPVSSYDDYVDSARRLVMPNPQEVGKRQGWYPLGTFAVSADSQTKVATHAIQLAMDSLGNVAGVSVSWPEGKVLAIRGRVDTDTQRVAFSIGGSDTAVAETGLANLTDPYTRVWVHLPNAHSQTWLISRIRE